MSNPNRPDPNRTHTEAVAEAIWRADINTGHRDFISEFDVSWDEDIGDAPKQHYRNLARAAIEAHAAALQPRWDAFVALLEQGARRYVAQGRKEKAEGIRWALAAVFELEDEGSWVAVPDSGGEQ